MTRFDPLTPEIVTIQSEGDLTYDELKKALYDCGTDIEKVVFDGSRSYQNAFYANFEQGHYCWIPFKKENLKEIIRVLDEQFHSPGFGKARRNHEWETFYMMDVPLPMQIWDFERRYKTIEPEKVFSVWSYLHTHIDYANGMWKPEVLDYVFAHAPQTELPEPDENGKITIYRGMGEKSLPAEEAISWSTDPVCALWFANRSARGTRLVFARVSPEQILVYNPGYHGEHEVILKPGVKPTVYEFGVGFPGGQMWPCYEEYRDSEYASDPGKAHLLISVCERDIQTEVHPSLEAAKAAMLAQLKKEFLKECSEAEWEDIESQDEFECSDLGFSKLSAWSNMDDDCYCDWRIIPIPPVIT